MQGQSCIFTGATGKSMWKFNWFKTFLVFNKRGNQTTTHEKNKNSMKASSWTLLVTSIANQTLSYSKNGHLWWRPWAVLSSSTALPCRTFLHLSTLRECYWQEPTMFHPRRPRPATSSQTEARWAARRLSTQLHGTGPVTCTWNSVSASLERYRYWLGTRMLMLS